MLGIIINILTITNIIIITITIFTSLTCRVYGDRPVQSPRYLNLPTQPPNSTLELKIQDLERKTLVSQFLIWFTVQVTSSVDMGTLAGKLSNPNR